MDFGRLLRRSVSLPEHEPSTSVDLLLLNIIVRQGWIKAESPTSLQESIPGDFWPLTYELNSRISLSNSILSILVDGAVSKFW